MKGRQRGPSAARRSDHAEDDDAEDDPAGRRRRQAKISDEEETNEDAIATEAADHRQETHDVEAGRYLLEQLDLFGTYAHSARPDVGRRNHGYLGKDRRH